jgi:hypothetical protein
VRNGLQRLRDKCTLPVLRRATKDKSAPRKHRASHLPGLTPQQVEDYYALTRKARYTRAEAWPR